MTKKPLTNTPDEVHSSGESAFTRFIEHSRSVTLIVMLLVLIASILLMITSEVTREPLPQLKAGEKAPRSVYSSVNFEIVDPEASSALQEQKIKELPFSFLMSQERTQAIRNKLDILSRDVSLRAKDEKDGKAYPNDLPAEVKKLDSVTLNFLDHVFSNSLKMNELTKAFNEALEVGLVPEEFKKSHASANPRICVTNQEVTFLPTPLSNFLTPQEAAQELVIGKLLNEHPIVNRERLSETLPAFFAMIFGDGNLESANGVDKNPSSYNREEAIQKIRANDRIYQSYLKGQLLIKKDAVITEQSRHLLAAYQSILDEQPRLDIWQKLAKSFVLSLAMMIFTAIYISHIHPEVVNDNRSIWLLGLVTIASLAANRLFIAIFSFLSLNDAIPLSYQICFLPLSVVALVISVVYGMRSALYAALFVSAVTAIATNNSFPMLITGLIVSGVSAFMVRKANNYKTFCVKGFLSISITTYLISSVFLWNRILEGDHLPWILLFPICTGLFSVILAQIILFLVEYIFDVTTNMSLLTFNDFDHPLLRRLQLEASGTFQHSLMVGNLAELAAKEIGANAVKTRICALFHDIGKLSRPKYFTENNPSGNLHQHLTPRESSRYIKEHVSYGMELARKYKLKKPLRDAIEQHHGTDLIYYFYRQAQEKSGVGKISERDFRYAGPLPQAKEIVLVMLADCSEAAVRSLEERTPQKIEELIQEIFRKKIRDGQLDRADLTFAELAKIRKVMTETLTTMNQGRIAYPKAEDEHEDDLFLASGKVFSETPSETVKKAH